MSKKNKLFLIFGILIIAIILCWNTTTKLFKNLIGPRPTPVIIMDHPVVDRSFVSSDPCAPPCWYGLEIDQSTTQDVFNVLNDLPFVVEESIFHKENYGSWQGESYTDQIWFDCPYYEGMSVAKPCGRIILYEDTVKEIWTIVAYPLIIEDVIDQIGPPEYVEYTTGDRGDCSIKLNYPLIQTVLYINVDINHCGSFSGEGYLELNHQIDRIIYQPEERFYPCGTFSLVACFPWDFITFPGQPTRPPALACESFKIGKVNKSDITDIEIDNKGSIWVSTYNDGIYQYLPTDKTWKQYTNSDGLAGNTVYSIAFSKEGVVWAAVDGGLSRFNGTSWQSWTTDDGLVDYNVYSLDFDSTGIVWIGTSAGISSFNPTTDEWKNYTTDDGLPEDYRIISFVKVTPDDNIWFAISSHGLLRFIPKNSISGSYKWVNYYEFAESEEELIDIYSVDDIAIAPDGTYWFAEGDLFQYQPITNTWREISSPYIGGANFIEFSEIGSLWIVPFSKEPMIIHWLSPNEEISINDLRFYDTRDGLPDLPDSVTDSDTVNGIAVAPDGSIWVATREDVTRCVLPNQ